IAIRAGVRNWPTIPPMNRAIFPAKSGQTLCATPSTMWKYRGERRRSARRGHHSSCRPNPPLPQQWNAIRKKLRRLTTVLAINCGEFNSCHGTQDCFVALSFIQQQTSNRHEGHTIKVPASHSYTYEGAEFV